MTKEQEELKEAMETLQKKIGGSSYDLKEYDEELGSVYCAIDRCLHQWAIKEWVHKNS